MRSEERFREARPVHRVAATQDPGELATGEAEEPLQGPVLGAVPPHDICMCVYTCVYIYIYRERERDTNIYIYIYIYIYVYLSSYPFLSTDITCGRDAA